MDMKDEKIKSELDSYILEINKMTRNLDDLFERIGFDKETKLNHIHKFFHDSLGFCLQMFKTAENYEDEVKTKIKNYQQNIMSLSLELGNQCDDHFANGQSMLNQEKLLQEYLVHLQAEKQQRLEEFTILSSKEESLCIQLNAKKLDVHQLIPSKVDIENLKIYIKELEDLKIQRLNQMAHYRLEIMEYSNGLEALIYNDSFVKLIVSEVIDNLPLSLEALDKTKMLCEDLKVKSEELNEQIRQLKLKIKQLWLSLNVSNQDLSHIIETNDGTVQAMNKAQLLALLNEEHQRCLKIKMENLEKIIERIRFQIRDFYNKMYFDESMVQDFKVFMNSIHYTEELLKRHENKLEELQFKYNENQMLIESLSRWLSLWKTFVEFDAKTKDPNRFKARGYNGAEENKQRKQYQQQLPKHEDELKKYADEYKHRNGGEIFKVYGIDWDVYVDNLRKANEKPKDNQKQVPSALKENNFNNSAKQRAPSLTKSAAKRKNTESVTAQRALSATRTTNTAAAPATHATAFSHQASAIRRSLRYPTNSTSSESKSLPHGNLNKTTSNATPLTNPKKTRFN